LQRYIVDSCSSIESRKGKLIDNSKHILKKD
jgi:hypothetical protein